MSKKSEKSNQTLFPDRDEYLLTLLNKEADSVNDSLSIIEEISKKHNIDFDQIAELLSNRERYISIPVGLFRSKLGPLETLVRYLKDVLDYSYSQIGKLLSRDETTIWTSYQNSLKKGKIVVDLEIKDIDFKSLKIKKQELIIPLSVFSERKLSVLESLCLYLYENFELSYHLIGILLDRDERTVWTVINRARKKLKRSFNTQKSRISGNFSKAEVDLGEEHKGGRKAPLRRGRS